MTFLRATVLPIVGIPLAMCGGWLGGWGGLLLVAVGAACWLQQPVPMADDRERWRADDDC